MSTLDSVTGGIQPGGSARVPHKPQLQEEGEHSREHSMQTKAQSIDPQLGKPAAEP